MATVTIDQKGAKLTRDGEAIAIYLSGGRHSTIPLRRLDRLLLVGDVSSPKVRVAPAPMTESSGTV
ncbi:hypothetical protein D5085_00025 [Ectothiorhodospiraceae bacterium BW-2]|nr:hypothetical protein D5085_00025 [Ectothiorhodospiraceae bacterium BW-2]